MLSENTLASVLTLFLGAAGNNLPPPEEPQRTEVVRPAASQEATQATMSARQRALAELYARREAEEARRAN